MELKPHLIARFTGSRRPTHLCHLLVILALFICWGGAVDEFVSCRECTTENISEDQAKNNLGTTQCEERVGRDKKRAQGCIYCTAKSVTYDKGGFMFTRKCEKSSLASVNVDHSLTIVKSGCTIIPRFNATVCMCTGNGSNCDKTSRATIDRLKRHKVQPNPMAKTCAFCENCRGSNFMQIQCATSTTSCYWSTVGDIDSRGCYDYRFTDNYLEKRCQQSKNGNTCTVKCSSINCNAEAHNFKTEDKTNSKIKNRNAKNKKKSKWLPQLVVFTVVLASLVFISLLTYLTCGEWLVNKGFRQFKISVLRRTPTDPLPDAAEHTEAISRISKKNQRRDMPFDNMIERMRTSGMLASIEQNAIQSTSVKSLATPSLLKARQ